MFVKPSCITGFDCVQTAEQQILSKVCRQVSKRAFHPIAQPKSLYPSSPDIALCMVTNGIDIPQILREMEVKGV